MAEKMTEEKGLKAFWTDLVKLAASFTFLSGIISFYHFTRKWFIDPHLHNKASPTLQTSKSEAKHEDTV